MTAFTARLGFLFCSTALMLGVVPSSALAETFRSSVVVERPAGMARRLADLEVDAAARKALVQAFIATRLSESLMTMRGSGVQDSLEPIARLIENFTVVAKADLDPTRVRVTCEGDIDSAAIVLQLVSNRILTFGEDPPRVLFMQAVGTRADAVQALRGRVADTLGAAGITLLAAEATQAAASARDPQNQAAAIAAGADAGADFVAVVAFSTVPAPSAVGGAVVDGTLQYTLIRPHDAVIIAEQVFNGRGSGTSAELASQMIVGDLAPRVARGLAGRLAEAIFSSGSVIDPSLPSRNIRVNVYARPDAAATNALVAVLRTEDVAVSLGSANAALRLPSSRQPADQLIVEGDVTVERLYDIFANAKFGQRNVLRASVFEYGDDHIGLEILDSTPPTVPPLPPPQRVVSISASAKVTPQGTPPAAQPLPAQSAQVQTVRADAGVDGAPLQFRLSAAFTARASARTPAGR